MLLTMAEVDKERKHYYNAKVSEFAPVLDKAMAARDAFSEMDDKQMEAYAWVVAADVHRRSEQAPSSWRIGANQTFDALDQSLLLFDETQDIQGTAMAKHMMALAYMHRNEVGEAVRLMEDARDGFTRAGNKRLEAYELDWMAEVHMLKKSGREALPNAEEALEIYKEIMPKSRRLADTRTSLVKAHLKRGDDETALRLAIEHVEMAEEQTRPRPLGIALMALASTYVMLGRFSDAVENTDAAMTIVRKLGDRRWEYDCLLEGVEGYLQKGENSWNEAMQMAEDAIAIAQEMNDRKREAVGYQKLNNIHLHRLVHSESLEQQAFLCYEKIEETKMEIFTELGDMSEAAVCRLGIVGLRGTEGEYETGKKLAEQCLRDFQSLNDKGGEASALHFLAELNSDLNHYDLAVRAARDMQAAGRAIGDDGVQIRALRALSKIHLRFESHKDAKRAAESALKYAERLMDGVYIVEFLLIIAQACTQIAQQDRHPTQARGMLSKALTQAYSALNVARRMRAWQSKVDEGRALVMVARVIMARGHMEDGGTKRCSLEEAMRFAKEAIDVFRKGNDVVHEAEATTVVALINFYGGEQGRAEDMAEQAVHLANRSGEAECGDLTIQVYQQIVGGGARFLDSERVRKVVDGRHRAGDRRYEEGHAGDSPAVDHKVVRDYVVELAGRTTDLQNPPDFDSPLVEFGMDSLTAVSFRNGLQQNFGLKLASSILFDFPTMRALTDHIVKESLRVANKEN